MNMKSNNNEKVYSSFKNPVSLWYCYPGKSKAITQLNEISKDRFSYNSNSYMKDDIEVSIDFQ